MIALTLVNIGVNVLLTWFLTIRESIRRCRKCRERGCGTKVRKEANQA
jgi:hypothetical protein